MQPAVSLGETGQSPGFHEHYGRIAAQLSDVLPRLTVEALSDALRRLPREEFEIALRHKILPIVSIPGLTLHAVCGEAAMARAHMEGHKVIAEADVSSFLQAVRLTHGPFLLRDASLGFAVNHPDKSASHRLTASQILLTAILALMLAAACVLLPGRIVWASASLLGGLFFLAVIALRILCLLPPVRRRKARARALEDSELPVYSVLVPLFREVSVLRQLLRALAQLEYPALCIKRTNLVRAVSREVAIFRARLPHFL